MAAQAGLTPDRKPGRRAPPLRTQRPQASGHACASSLAPMQAYGCIIRRSFACPPLSPPVPELQPDSAAAAAPPAPPPASDPSPNPPNPPDPPESEPLPHRWPGIDGPGTTQAIGGLAVGLIALLSSYDHITFLGHILPLPQQWGIPIIAASVAIIFIDAQLATRSRLRAKADAVRAAQDAARLAHATARERYPFRRRDGSKRTAIFLSS